MKQPTACQNLADIRTEIDRIDKQIVELIGERALYVQKAAVFKQDLAAVKDIERVTRMLLQRKDWALQSGLNPAFIEKLFRDIVAHFISRETKQWQTGEPI